MVLHKRIEYGFNGFQVPFTPRAPRSARRRGSFWKKFDNQMCTFDLLATVVGKLLLEEESSPSSTDMSSEKGLAVGGKDSVKKELDIDKAMQNEPWDHETCDGSSVVSDLVSEAPFLEHSLKECPNAQNETCSGLASIITTSDCLENAKSTELVKVATKIELGCSSCNVDVGSSSSGVSSICRLEDKTNNQIKNEISNNGNRSTHGIEMCSSWGPVVCDRESSALVGLENVVKLPVCTDQIYGGSYSDSGNEVKLVFKDDAKKTSGCSQPSSENKAYRPSPCIGEQRVRKLLASKYLKIPSELKVKKSVSTGTEIRPVYHNRKSCFRRQWSQRDYPFKKRKLYRYNTLSTSGGGINISSSSWKAFNEDLRRSSTEVHSASGTSTSRPGQHCLQSRESHVKLKIKSFRVPELFIEIAETATVGNLKRAVMEAVTSILGGELRVGVLHKGKSIGDDSKTLLQTGISCDERLDSLGFTLEPDPSQAPQPLCPEYCPFLLPCDVAQSLVRYAPDDNVVQRGTPDVSPDQQMTNFGNLVETDYDSVPFPHDMSIGKASSDSRALIAIPAMKVEALTAVPMRKSKRSEALQRRIRRPFSVSEVEALVQTVEKLGTGRWRDVKLQAFDSAKHRTYVDLKDKWKTLVHTARISPQQRRGEPVPQELLDRVLAAHAYWLQRQTNQQLKQQQAQNCLLF